MGNLDMSFEPTFHKVAQAYPKWPVVVNDRGTAEADEVRMGRDTELYENAGRDQKRPEVDGERPFGKSDWIQKRTGAASVQTVAWCRLRAFSEHREIPGWKNKVPYYIRLKNRDMLFIAGLYAYSHLPNPETGELPGTFTVLTRDANDVMSRIHNGGDNAEPHAADIAGGI